MDASDDAPRESTDRQRVWESIAQGLRQLLVNTCNASLKTDAAPTPETFLYLVGAARGVLQLEQDVDVLDQRMEAERAKGVWDR